MTTSNISGAAIGWTWFAAVMLWLIGVMHFFAGLVGVLEDEFYVATPKYLLQFDATAWGWIHMITGVIIFLAGVYLLSGAVWARVVGVFIAILSILANFAWMPYYPIWSIIMITVGVFVIWSLTVHGRDITADM